MKKWFQDKPQIAQATVLIPALIIVVLVLMRGFLLNRTEEYPIQDLDDGWVITRNDDVLDTGTLTQVITGEVARGEMFTLTRALPGPDGLPGASLFFRSLHTTVRVTLDGREIYTSGLELYEAGRMVARGLCFVPLPSDRVYRILTIELVCTEEDTLHGLGPVLYGTEQDLFTRVINERKYAFYIGIFLCMFGIIQLLWLPILLFRDRDNIRLLFSALTTLVLGIYLLGYYNLFDLFVEEANFNTIMEYTALYSVGGCMSGYITTVSEGRLRKLYVGYFVAVVIFVVTTLLLHRLNIVHYIRFLLASYVLNFVGAMPFMAMILTGWNRRRQTYYDRLERIADRALAIGFVSYVIGSFLNAAIFMIVRVTGGQEATVTIPFVTIGSLVYSFAICMHYFLHGVVNLRTEATRQRLQEKAYTDSLTGLSNRGECEMVLERLSREHSRFVIISMDMDNLKKVNDTCGHDAGDQMLVTFADMLREAFSGCALIGRMGGDEYLVILTGDDCETADDRLKKMSDLITAKNAENGKVHYSVSYGVAKNGEGRLGRRAHDVYMLADARMYDMKRRHK